MDCIVVTGATSMLGVALIEQALKNCVECIYAVVQPGSKKINRLPEDNRIKIIESDIGSYKNLTQKIKTPCDTFYHIAWACTGPRRNDDIVSQCKNIEYTLLALRAAKELGCKKFIGTGSQAEYGILDVPKISPDSPINPVQPYGIAKYASGKLASEEAKKLGIDFFWVRVFSVYGFYDKPTTLISSTIQKLLAGEHTSYTPATQLWDYLYSTDAGNALYLIGKKSTGNKVYCLGSGQALPLREYIETLRDIVAPDAELGIGEIPFKDNSVLNLCADISGIVSDTGWKPEYSFLNGISEIINKRRSGIE